ncbi:hypothetical protein PVAP13_7KG122021 [Panicum virgatum]|uniref:Uncharacterized protein n=1 Tax=Panicum virgatum TaxID=38727 RepID=A0A8T0QA84_PANVG|nr:hypothetical protein PVAP13_7KG122021 [Panicum virgatum]
MVLKTLGRALPCLRWLEEARGEEQRNKRRWELKIDGAKTKERDYLGPTRGADKCCLVLQQCRHKMEKAIDATDEPSYSFQ